MCNVLEIANAAEVIVNGETIIENRGTLSEKEIRLIRQFIKENYKEMYLKWSEKSENSFYGEIK